MSVTSKENWDWRINPADPGVFSAAGQTHRFFSRRLLRQFVFILIVLSTQPLLAAQAPSLLILDGSTLNATRLHGRNGDAALAPALARLRRDADRALDRVIETVTEKSITPPSGDKHDYLSLAPYWWPDPNTGNGLPYIRRDGEVNPERDRVSDRKRLNNVIQAVKSLAAGYFFIGGEKYAKRAVKLVRAWFLDESSRMNPHLRFAQAVAGRSQGRGTGIIETHNLPELIDSVGLLSSSPEWRNQDHAGLQRWFADYLHWLLESPEGIAEGKALNNHGSWYDVQIAAYALFVGRDDLAKRVTGAFAAKRIAGQIESDGSQPLELARTRSWHYAIFNLEAIFDAAAIGDRLGIDLWNFHSADQRGIRKALDWLAPFAAGKRIWSHPQRSPFQPEKLAPLLRRAAVRYRDPGYESVLGNLKNSTADQRWRLLHAMVPPAKE